MNTPHSRILVIGGGSGIGHGIADRFLRTGAHVTIAGRNAERLNTAAERLGAPPELSTAVIDLTDEDTIRDHLSRHRYDHIITTAIDVHDVYRPVATIDPDTIQRVLATKVAGPLLLAKHAGTGLTPDGTLTITAGFNAHRPAPGGAVVSAANGALEALARALAVELAPRRVNAISPGWVDTDLWDVLAGDARRDRLDAMADRLPAGRVGTADDIASAVEALTRNGYITGTIIHVDGGQRLV